MLLPHAALLTRARSCIAALADHARTAEASSAYEQALIELDRIHDDNAPALDTADPPDDGEALLAAATSAIEELADYGVEQLQVEPLLAALTDAETRGRRMTWKVANGRYNPSMRSKDALRVLAEITAYQWGMVTSAQAGMHGVTRLDLSRLAADGLLERLLHGVYKTTSTPSDGLDRLRAAWLSTAPKHLAHERRTTDPNAVVFAGASAARIHGIGDVWDDHFNFITPVRRQSQRDEVRYRKRLLDPRDITTVDGLPVMTIEATIADLVEVVGDLSLVADALRDAWHNNDLDSARLTELLGSAMLTRLTELAGVEQAVTHD